MTMPLNLGFVPLCDAAALIVAKEMGFFADQGLEVELSREMSWATIRDKLAVGALDGAQMLAPMAIAQSLGLGCEPTPIVAPLALGWGGAALTVSSRLVLGADPAAGLADLVRRRREADASPLTFSIVFPYSIHNCLLRNWMSDAGIDPDRDVRITVAGPPRMAALLAGGVIEGFCAGEPWNAVAEEAGFGHIAVRMSELAPRAPDKVFGFARTWGERHPEIAVSVLRALLRALAWIEAKENRATLLALLARPEHLDASPAAIAAGLEHIAFANSRVDAGGVDWLLGQMVRWGQLDGHRKAEAASVFESGLHGLALIGA